VFQLRVAVQYYSLSYLGMARGFGYAGETAKARKAFQDFFELRKDADPDILFFSISPLRRDKVERDSFWLVTGERTSPALGRC
jgi:hypothetical protein